MSQPTRPAQQEDIFRLWPAVKAAHLMTSAEEFSAFRDAAPWRVRVNEAGEALVLAQWRGHLNVLAIRGLWSAPHHLGDLVDDACAVARAQGFARVLSPLITGDACDAYLAIGMSEVERIVALQGAVGDVIAHRLPAGARIRSANSADLPALARLDEGCFNEFWRYGAVELADSLGRERVTVVETHEGAIEGYSTCACYGATVTVGRLAVAPAARRHGVGRALLSDVASWAQRSGAYALTLCTQEANAASRALYAVTGLVELPERYLLAMRCV